MNFKTKKSLMLYCLSTVTKQFNSAKISLDKPTKTILNEMNIAQARISTKGVASMNHNNDARTIEAMILCEPIFITDVKQIKNTVVPVFKNQDIQNMFKGTVASLLNRLGHKRNDQVVVRRKYATIIPKQIFKLRKLLAKANH